MKGNNRVRVNLTLGSPSHHHCLYGYSDHEQKEQEQGMTAGGLVMTTVETDRFLRILPKYHQQSTSQWQLFDSSNTDLWLVQCYQPK